MATKSKNNDMIPAHEYAVTTRDPYRVGSYVIGRLLGTGAFSRVFTCIDSDNYIFAMKIVNRVQYRKNMDKSVLREIAIMQSLSHPFIIRLYDVMKSKRHFYVVQELVQGGELGSYVAANYRLTEERARLFFHQLIVGVRYMHHQGFAHRDLKSQNLLLDDEGNLRISDFGLSNIQPDGALLWTACGTVTHMAPEVVVERGYSGFTADVWACGCILYHMLVGTRPIPGKNREIVKKQLRAREREPVPPFVSEHATDLLNRMLDFDPQSRITIDEIVEHPWFVVDFDKSWLKLGKGMS